MGRRNRVGFGDLTTSRAAFERDEAKCPLCKRPIGPRDQPIYARAFGGSLPRFATLRCGRCSGELTLHFDDADARTE